MDWRDLAWGGSRDGVSGQPSEAHRQGGKDSRRRASSQRPPRGRGYDKPSEFTLGVVGLQVRDWAQLEHFVSRPSQDSGSIVRLALSLPKNDDARVQT